MVGQYAYTISDIKKAGSNETWKANNIYDIAGNAREFTQEVTDEFQNIETPKSRSVRGGFGGNSGENEGAAGRTTAVHPNEITDDYTSRPVLIVK